MFLRPSSIIRTLPVSSAECAFVPLTIKEMKDLAAIMKRVWPKPKPQSERDIAHFLVKTTLNVDDAKAFEIVDAHRFKKKLSTRKYAGQLGKTTGHCVEGLLHADEVRAVVGLSNEQEVERQVDKQMAASARAKAKPRKLMLVKGGEFSEADARKLIPQGVVGCTLAKDEKLHMRWKASYATPADEQGVFTRVWNEERSSKEALFQCLDWLWSAHFRLTGEVCPSDFSI